MEFSPFQLEFLFLVALVAACVRAARNWVSRAWMPTVNDGPRSWSKCGSPTGVVVRGCIPSFNLDPRMQRSDQNFCCGTWKCMSLSIRSYHCNDDKSLVHSQSSQIVGPTQPGSCAQAKHRIAELCACLLIVRPDSLHKQHIVPDEVSQIRFHRECCHHC